MICSYKCQFHWCLYIRKLCTVHEILVDSFQPGYAGPGYVAGQSTVITQQPMVLPQPIILKQLPVNMRCPHCGATIITKIDHRVGNTTFIYCCMLSMFGWECHIYIYIIITLVFSSILCSSFLLFQTRYQTFSCTKFCSLEFHWSELHVIEQNV